MTALEIRAFRALPENYVVDRPRCEACDGTGYRSDVWRDDVKSIKCSTCFGSGVELVPPNNESSEPGADKKD